MNAALNLCFISHGVSVCLFLDSREIKERRGVFLGILFHFTSALLKHGTGIMTSERLKYVIDSEKCFPRFSAFLLCVFKILV